MYLAVDLAGSKEFVVRADTDGFSVVEDYYLIRGAYRRRALRDDEDRRLVRKIPESLPESGVGREIKRGRAVVENQYLRPSDERAGYRQPLLLTSGEILSSLKDGLVELLFLLVDEFLRLRCNERFLERFVVRVLVAPEKV